MAGGLILDLIAGRVFPEVIRHLFATPCKRVPGERKMAFALSLQAVWPTESSIRKLVSSTRNDHTRFHRAENIAMPWFSEQADGISPGRMEELMERTAQEARERICRHPKRVLLLPPDITRAHSGAGWLTELLYQSRRLCFSITPQTRMA